MREDGVMNMVAIDGSACGTSISWCFPFFCAASIFDRTRDLAWLRQLYPRLASLMRWTLANRSDSGGFLVGKCSWETGMDTSKRFRIKQPTGGEVVDFLRLVELQAAAAQAGGILARFAEAVGDSGNIQKWRALQHNYAEKTQQLWKNDWFHDYDTQAGQLVTGTTRDPSQAAPAFCGIATEEQKQRILPTLRSMYEELKAQASKDVPQGGFSLDWSSFVLPFLESAWSSGDGGLVAETVELIANRIYTGMDRRTTEGPAGPDGKPRRLGWPGVSCEIWGASGAFGGEGYGWGAVMPAHIMRDLVGLRETDDARRITLAPNFGSSLAARGKRYGIEGFLYGRYRFDLVCALTDERRIQVEVQSSEGVEAVSDAGNQPLRVERKGGRSRFEVVNHERYTLTLASV